MSLCRKAEFVDQRKEDWYIWSYDDTTVSCIPYCNTDDGGSDGIGFVFDLKHFPIEEIANV